jgi:hypothetical protein
LASRRAICDVCHDTFFFYTFDSEGKIVDIIPIQLTKIDNLNWTAEDIKKLKNRVVGRSIFKPFAFDPKVDSISGATITGVLIFDGLGKAKEIYEKMKKEGYIRVREKNFNHLRGFRGYIGCLLLIAFPHFSYSNELFKFHQVSMGTIIEVALIGENQEKAEKAALQAFHEIRRIEQLMSPKIETGDVFRINQSAGKEWVEISPETLHVVSQ